MSGRNVVIPLVIIAMGIACDRSSRAQDAGKIGETPTTAPADAGKEGKSPSPEQRESIEIGNTFPDRAPNWAEAPKFGKDAGKDFDEVPAITDACASEEDTEPKVAEAIHTAMINYLFDQTGYSQAARRIGLTPTDFNPASFERIKEQSFRENGEPDRIKKAILLKVPHKTSKQWLDKWHSIKQQSAVAQTLFVGGGLLGAVAILAIQAKSNHATNGRRSGILRAVAAIAILTLFGGLTTAAVLGRIFSV